MSRYWIDIENYAGEKQGAGPIITALEWEDTRRMDRAGKFYSRMPGGDPRSALLQEKFVARCWMLINEVVTEIGAGVIDKIERSLKNSGDIGLAYSGDDLMRELTNLHVGNLLIGASSGATTSAPSDIMALAPLGWFLDTDAGFETTVTTVSHQFARETVLQALTKISEMTGEHFRLGVGRKIVWMRRSGSAKLVGSTVDTYTSGEGVTGGTSGATGTIIEQASDDTWLYIEDVDGIFVDGEDVIGDTSGASFTVTTAYNPHSGVVAIQASNVIAMESNANICIVTRLQESQDSYDSRIGRIYATGSGLGDDILTLADVTITPPSGYALGVISGKGYYLEHTATWNAYGIERVVQYKDIANADDLYHLAYEYLRKAAGAGSTAYELEVTKLDKTVEVGQTIRVQYRRSLEQVDGTNFQAINIDADLYILEKTTRVDAGGMRVCRFVVADIDAWPKSDAGTVVELMETFQALGAHAQPVPGVVTPWYRSVLGGRAAYDPYAAADYAESKINLLNPGTDDAQDGPAYPTHAQGTGWTLQATLHQYLTTGIIPATFDGVTGAWSMFVLYDNSETLSEQPLLSAGNVGTATMFELWANQFPSAGKFYGMGGASQTVAPVAAGTWTGISGLKCWHDGVHVATLADTPSAATGDDIKIGLHSPTGWCYQGNIKRVIIFPFILSDAEVAVLYTAMTGMSAPAVGAEYLLMAASGSLPDHRVLTAGNGLTVTDGGAGSTATISLGTPGTLAHNSANSAATPHTHAVTASADPGAAESLLKSNASGGLALSGDLYFRTDGSTTASPRTIGFLDVTGGRAYRIGDVNVGLQSANNTVVSLYSYWGLELSGNRQTTAPAFVAGAGTDASVRIFGTTAAAPVLQIDGAAGQAGAHTEWRTVGGVVSASVDKDFYARFPRIGLGIAPSYPLHVSGVSYLDGQVIINDAHADVDCRIEGDTDANLIYTDAGNNRVGIGIAAPLAKLHVAGTTDVIQAIVQESAAQVANWQEWRTSGGTRFISINSFGLGMGTDATAERYLHISKTWTDTSGSKYGVYTNTIVNPGASASSAVFYNYYSQLTLSNSSTNNLTSTNTAAFLVTAINNKSSGTVTRLTGAKVGVTNLNSGAMTGTRGLYIDCENSSTGTIGTYDGLYVNLDNSGGGAITTARGIYIEDVNAATLNYAIYTNAGLVRFGDDVQIDSDSKGLKLGDDQDLLLYSDGAGVLYIKPTAADTDTTVNFFGTTNSGVMKWMEDEDRFEFTDKVLMGDKLAFTQTDENEYIDSLNDGYMDYGATTLHRFNNPLTIANIKSGADQAAAGAAANELWKTAGHVSLPNNVVMIGV